MPETRSAEQIRVDNVKRLWDERTLGANITRANVRVVWPELAQALDELDWADA